MEIFALILLLIVPVISVVSLFIAMRTQQSNKAIKELLTVWLKDNRQKSAADMALDEFKLMDA